MTVPTAIAKYGRNERDRILQLAVGGGDEHDEEASDLPSATGATHTLDDAERQAVGKQVSSHGPLFLQALAVKHRPIAPFINRPRMPRVLRQKLLDKLAGQHLAVEAFRAGRLDRPEEVAADDASRSRAIEKAAAQEADVYQRSKTAQVYSNLAARTAALDWQPVEQQSAACAEQGYEERLGRQTGAASKQPARGERGGGASRAAGIKRQAPGNAPSPKRSTPSALEEDDLNWEGGVPDVSPRAASRVAALRSNVRRRIADELAQLPAAAGLSAEESIAVADRCTEKVLERHNEDGAGAQGGEGMPQAALRRLVAGYVQYVTFVLRKNR